MMSDRALTAPTRRAGSQVSFAVAVGVESFLDFGAFEVFQGLTIVFFNVSFRDEVPLQSASLDDVADFLSLVVKVLW